MSEVSKTELHRSLLNVLQSNGLTEYGSHIPGDLVRSTIGLEYPDVGTKAEFDKLALAELAAVDYCRNVLLGQGKYLAGVNGDYRILLPSENSRQVEQYMKSADQKLVRALKLSRNSPAGVMQHPDQTASRIHMKRIGIRQKLD